MSSVATTSWHPYLATMRLPLALAFATFALSSCVTRQSVSRGSSELPAGTEAVSLFDEPLLAPPLTAADRVVGEADLAKWRAIWAAHSDSALALVWVGRKLAALYRFQEAIATWTDGMNRFPGDPRFARFRGYRYVTVRNFEAAVKDLEQSYAVLRSRPDWEEPEDPPNPPGTHTGSIQAGNRYQLALAHYLLGHFDAAAAVQREDLEHATNPDTRIASSYWHVMTLKRLGRDAEATRLLAGFSRDSKVDHSTAYLRLLLLFKGDLPVDSIAPRVTDTAPTLEEATLNYGVGVWHLVAGRRDAAIASFRRSRAGLWAGFGAIAAEAELKRLGVAVRP